MDSTNIDHLLRNYPVSDVLQVQKKLKSDAEKKKNDLKMLIGERYDELFKAADSFEKMNSSVDTLIHSLRLLNGLNGVIPEDGKPVEQEIANQNDYSTAKLYQVLFDLPLKIWNQLHSENFVLATYSYLYAIHITDMIANSDRKESALVSAELFFTRSKSIVIISHYIIRNSWRYLQEHSVQNEIDYTKFAQIFSCLIILKNLSVSELLVQFFERQSKNVHFRLTNESPVSSLIVAVCNIIFNTIKCSKLFESREQPIFAKTFQSIISTNFLDKICDIESLPENLNCFVIQEKIVNKRDVQIEKLREYFAPQSIKEWVKSAHEQFFSIIQDKFKNVKSIKELSFEIQTAEKALNQGGLFNAWKEFNTILDLKTNIWQTWFIHAFESRIYEIAEERLKSMVDSFVSLLPKFKKTLVACDLSIVEHVWKSQNAKNSEFISMIIKSCEIINGEMKSFHEEIVIFREKHPSFVAKICTNISNFLFNLKQHIDSYKEQQKSFILFGAILFKKIIELCPNLRSIFETQSDWNQLENQINSVSESYLLEWFTLVITDHFADLDPARLTDLENFLRNLSLWETVSLPGDNNETASVFEVPFQLSLMIFEVLQNICVDINRYCAHLVPRKVQIEILALIGKHLVRLYEQSTERLQSNDSLPQSCKQIVSIQLYFDLFFIKKIFTNSKEDTLRTVYPSKINEILTSLEANIDPFDMHLIHPHIEINSDRLHKSFQITFGFLFAERYSFASVQASVGESISKEMIHNFMLIHSCQDDFKIVTDAKSTAQHPTLKM